MLTSARAMLSERFGPIDTESEVYPFTFSTYYVKEMGTPLVKRFVSFADLIAPDQLADIKRFANGLEQRIPRTDGKPGRGVNLDPGYLAAAKVVLATTKDYSHRVYLGGGIFAEVALQFRCGAFESLPWTYPDYKTDLALTYFARVRTAYMEQRWRIPPNG